MTPSDFPSSICQSMTSYRPLQTSAVWDSYQILNANFMIVPALKNMFFLAALQLCHKEDTDGSTTTSSERRLPSLNKKGKRNPVVPSDNI
ncbi:hypothetical protein DPMN_102864 [Dreissena polymorpha]|uniref:Uncharacterized protein n=1 Tax=Dreissena polymorpha TaxID=45954 RepID=A0A9D4HDC8_DREPO|nr:hypothetical protein DPMN_102864 [Dreissena polymorpha]